MSHLKQRSGKNCLNCNAIVQGNFCHICGQENLEPQESAWHLVTHFFNDITHFDGKFFSTLKYLLVKPGFLSSEYKQGRRSSYLNPIRMYVFTSAIFFLIFFNMQRNVISTKYSDKTEAEILKMNPVELDSFTRKLNNGIPMSMPEIKSYMDSIKSRGGLHFTTSAYKNKAAYDSVLKSGKKDHNWIERSLIYKEIEMNDKYKGDREMITKQFVSNLFHSFPQMFFISLPVFAFLLKLLYYRRKDFYYASHAIFGVHQYVFVFIMLLLIILIKQAYDILEWNFFNYLTGLVVAGILFYFYKAMRNFYQQKRAKTILKYLLLLIMMFIFIGALFLVFVLFSIMKT